MGRVRVCWPATRSGVLLCAVCTALSGPHPQHTPIWGTHPVRGPTASIGGNMALFSGDSRMLGVAREMAWSNVSLDSGRALRV
jgi:hypothetical protein